MKSLITQKASPVVMKSSAVIHSGGEGMTAFGRKVFNVLIYVAYRELLEKEKHTIKLSDLYCLLGHTCNRPDSYIRKTLEHLVNTKLKFNILEKYKGPMRGDGHPVSWHLIGNGILQYSFPEPLRIMLADPNMYARIKIYVENIIIGNFSLILYEICSDYYRIKDENGMTPVITIENFKDLMNVKGKYEKFKSLRQWVIDKAMLEINEKSDIFVTMKKIKKGRTVIAVQFIITKNKNYVDGFIDIPENFQLSLFDQKGNPEIHVQEIEETPHRNEGLEITKTTLISLRFVNNEIQNLIKKYGERKVIDYVKLYTLQTTHIENKKGWICEALEKKYDLSLLRQGEEKKQKKERRKREDTEKGEQEKKEELERKEQNIKIEKWIKKNPKLYEELCVEELATLEKERGSIFRLLAKKVRDENKKPLEILMENKRYCAGVRDRIIQEYISCPQ